MEPCSQDPGDGVGPHSAKATVHWVVTPEEEQQDSEADGDNYTGLLSASEFVKSSAVSAFYLESV